MARARRADPGTNGLSVVRPRSRELDHDHPDRHPSAGDAAVASPLRYSMRDRPRAPTQELPMSRSSAAAESPAAAGLSLTEKEGFEPSMETFIPITP